MASRGNWDSHRMLAEMKAGEYYEDAKTSRAGEKVLRVRANTERNILILPQ